MGVWSKRERSGVGGSRLSFSHNVSFYLENIRDLKSKLKSESSVFLLQVSSCQIGGRHCLLDKTNWKNNRNTLFQTNVSFTFSVLVSASNLEDPQIETFESAVWFRLVVQLWSKIRLESSWKLSNLILYIWNSAVLREAFLWKKKWIVVVLIYPFFLVWGRGAKLSR